MKKMIILITALIFNATCYASELVQLPSASIIYGSLSRELGCERFLRKSGLHRELGGRTLSSDIIVEEVEKAMYNHMSHRELNSKVTDAFKFRLLKIIIASGQSE